MANRKHTFVDFTTEPPVPTFLNAAVATIGAGADNTAEHFVTANSRTYFEHRFEQACTDIGYTPTATGGAGAVSGWIMPNDQTDNEGLELTQGILAGHCNYFTVGTDPAFFFRLKWCIPAPLDYDMLAIGFHTRAAYADALNGGTADYDEWTDLAAFNIDNGDIYTMIQTTGTAFSATDTTDDFTANGSNSFRVDVSAAGVVTFKHDIAAAGTLAAPTVTQALTIADGAVLIPFVHICRDATAAADTPPILIEWECGYSEI